MFAVIIDDHMKQGWVDVSTITREYMSGVRERKLTIVVDYEGANEIIKLVNRLNGE